MIWNYDVNDIVKGYHEQKENYCCLVCQKEYEKGRIYQMDNGLYDAKGAIKNHLKEEHKNMATYLLGLDIGLTGITEIQRKLLLLLLDGKSDKEIAKELNIAQSTVRNHRFKLREKEKQAKLFTALMTSLELETNSGIDKSDAGIIEEIHMSATMVDDRYSITDKERQKTVDTYMCKDGSLKQFPTKEKKKIIVLGEIMKNFKMNEEYSEIEINNVLKRVFEEDYPTIRRALIEYGFMERSMDCKVYKVKK